MVDGISGSGAGKAAIEAALKRIKNQAKDLGGAPSNLGSAASGASAESSFAEALKSGIGEVESKVESAGKLHEDALSGRLDIHEVAASLKESELTFQFALQVRNKLMDSYREVMRMSV